MQRCLEEVLSHSSLLSKMLEFNNDNRHIIRGMVRKGVFQQFVAGLLSVLDLANEFDCTLIPNYIPKLRGVISLHNTLIKNESNLLHHRLKLTIRRLRRVLFL